jgi:hypothetical protein
LRSGSTDRRRNGALRFSSHDPIWSAAACRRSYKAAACCRLAAASCGQESGAKAPHSRSESIAMPVIESYEVVLTETTLGGAVDSMK